MMPGERKVRISTKHTMGVIGGDPTVAELQEFLAEKNPAARVRFHKQSPDRPGEMTTTRIEVTEE